MRDLNQSNGERISIPSIFVQNSWFFVWAAITAYVYLHVESLATDEIGFISIANSIPAHDILLGKVLFGYGQLYWLAMHFFNIWIARISACIAALLSPALILLTSRNMFQMERQSVLLMWLSCPAAFWTGKLIGPEIFTMLLASAAIYAIHTGRAIPAGFCCGVATGLKLSSLPVAAFVAGLIILNPVQRSRSLILFIIFCIVGAFLTYPNLLNAKPTGIGFGSIDLRSTFVSLSAQRWEWDGIFSGGGLAFSIAVLPLCSLVIIALICRPMLTIVFLNACMLQVLLLALSATQYGWYCFPMIPALLYVVSQVASYSPSTMFLVTLVAVFNIVVQAPTSVAMMSQKYDQIDALGDQTWVGCISPLINSQARGTKILNLSEFGSLLQIPEYIDQVDVPHISQAQLVIVMQRMLVAAPLVSSLDNYKLAKACGHALVFER